MSPDVERALVEGLRAATSERVEYARTATYDGSPVSVVSVLTGPSGAIPNRFLFYSTATITTTAPSAGEALDSAQNILTALMGLHTSEGLRLSSTRCTSEPQVTGEVSPTGAVMVTATYETFVRKDN